MSGLDEELMNRENKLENVISMDEVKKKRPAFCFWEVAGVQHKLKLTTSMISMLENKYKTNVANLILDEGMPTLSIMLTVVQAALNTWEHGISFNDVQKLYDKWVECDDGNQQELMAKVVIPILAVSGFFTTNQAQSMMESLTSEDYLM